MSIGSDKMVRSSCSAAWVIVLLATFFDSAAHTAAFAPSASTAFRSVYDSAACAHSGRQGWRAPWKSERKRQGAQRLRSSADPEGGGLSDADISGLLARVSAAKDRVQTLPVCVLDATLPKQRLEFATDDMSFSALLAYCKSAAGGDGLGKFGMLGSLPHSPILSPYI
jgi:hypothetical protein